MPVCARRGSTARANSACRSCAPAVDDSQCPRAAQSRALPRNPGIIVGVGGAASDELELGAHLDAALEASGDRAEPCVESVHALNLIAAVVRNGEPIVNGDALDDEHLFLEHHVADCLDLIALRIDIDVARFQRAGEGAGQSAASGRHHVIQRRCVRGVLVGADAVVLSDLGMNAKRHRLMFGWQVREPLRATQPLDPHTGHVCGLGRHGRGGYYLGRPGRGRTAQPRDGERRLRGAG